MYGYDEINWKKAACEGAPTSLFYIVEEDKRVVGIIGTEPTRRICGTCPIWKECLGYAMNNEEYGMWGGFTSRERRALQRRDNPALRETAIKDFTKYGVQRAEIEAVIHEHKNYE